MISWSYDLLSEAERRLFRQLNVFVGGFMLEAAEAVWNGDATEAEGFAYMAVRSLHGLPISFPGTTGVQAPLVGGTLHPVAEL